MYLHLLWNIYPFIIQWYKKHYEGSTLKFLCWQIFVVDVISFVLLLQPSQYTTPPPSLCFSPLHSSMFWLDDGWEGRSTLERSWMDGSDRGTLAVLTAQQAHGLTADVAARRLYWISDLKMVSLWWKMTVRKQLAMLREFAPSRGVSTSNTKAAVRQTWLSTRGFLRNTQDISEMYKMNANWKQVIFILLKLFYRWKNQILLIIDLIWIRVIFKNLTFYGETSCILKEKKKQKTTAESGQVLSERLRSSSP